MKRRVRIPHLIKKQQTNAPLIHISKVFSLLSKDTKSASELNDF